MCFAAIGVLGGIVSGIGSLMAGQAQAAAYRAQAEADRQQGQAESTAGSYESAQKQRELARLTGKQITAIAASGVDLAGTPVDVVKDSTKEGYLDVGTIRANWQNKANMSYYQSAIDKMNAKQAELGGYLGAIAPVLSGIGGAFG